MDVRPVKLMLIFGVSLSVVRAMLQWAAPWPLKLIFDSVLSHHPLPSQLRQLPTAPLARLQILSLIIIAIAVLLAITNYGTNASLANAGQKMVFALRCRLFDHLERQSAEFHLRHPVGDLLSRLGGDIQAIQGVMVNVVPIFVENGLTVLGMITIMFFIDWRYSLIFLSLTPLLYFAIRHYLAAIKLSQREARNVEGLATAKAQEVLISLPVVQVFATEEKESEVYAQLANKALGANKRSVLLQSRFIPLVAATMTISTTVVVYFGARAVVLGHLTPGDLIIFSAYLRGIYTPIRQLAKTAGMLGRGQASADRVLEVLNASSEVKESPKRIRPKRVEGRLTMEKVSYSYDGSSLALKEIDLEIKERTMHAIIGATGSGKSSLIRLIPRLMDPTDGFIRLDGVPITNISLTYLRSLIALVPQEPFLMSATVWENICYGSSAISKETAIKAAKQAGVHEVVESLRDGYDTFTGERGGALSGGQKQCVAFARAVAKTAPIILLDEPASGLDVATEAVLLRSLEKLADGRTLIHITHHIDTVLEADSITLLSKGEVVEQGSHKDLLALGKDYFKLHQVKDFASVQG